MIVGTAGHIDHGKTTLIRALTGVDTDRLKEEKARGISIELGYAYAPVSNGEVLGFVDVPGHERLVHTMAAGACGIDFALLVIAADDGVMPQTREHAAILQLLGIERGAVVLTKVDRVDAARLKCAEAEVRALLASTVFREAPLFRVNAAAEADVGTGQLKAYLEASAAAFDRARPLARDSRLFRLAIDRVFTLSGHGTVVAGTVFSGTVTAGDRVAVFPSNIPVRVRSIHAQNRPVEAGHSGERCALTLVGVETSDVKRGDWLADERAFAATSRIDVRLELLTGTGPLKPGSPVHFHHGAAHLTARLSPLETAVCGASCHAQIVFETPICAVAGDRFVIRDAQALHTLGGGIILDPYAPARKRKSAQRRGYLDAVEQMISGQGVMPLLQQAPYGITCSELTRLCGNAAIRLPEGTVTIAGARERYVLLTSAWRGLRDRTVEALRQFHVQCPEEPGPDTGRLRRIAFPLLPDDTWRCLISELVGEGTVVRNGPWVHMPGHAVTLSPAEQSLAGKLQPLIAAGRFNPPWVRDLADTLKVPEDRVRQVLCKEVTQGVVYQVVHDLFYDSQCVNELATVVTRLAHEHGAVQAADYRDALGLGRKRAIQILEFFDRVGHTRRIRDSRVVRSDSSWRSA